jgi:hypothetical protein
VTIAPLELSTESHLKSAISAPSRVSGEAPEPEAVPGRRTPDSRSRNRIHHLRPLSVDEEHARLAAAGVPLSRAPATGPWDWTRRVSRTLTASANKTTRRGSRRPPSSP